MTGCYQTPILHYMKKPSAETTPDSHLNGTKRTKEREGGGVATGEATLVAKDDLLSSSHAQPSTPSHRSMIRGGRLQCCKSRCRQSRIKGQRMRNANFPPLGMPPPVVALRYPPHSCKTVERRQHMLPVPTRVAAAVSLGSRTVRARP